MNIFRQVWTNLDKFGQVWTARISVNQTKHFLALSEKFESIYTSLNQFGQVWTNLDKFEPI